MPQAAERKAISLVGTIMLLIAFAAASAGRSAAESPEHQAGKGAAATFYKARYSTAGLLLLRAGTVCQYQPKRMISAAVRLIATPEIKAISQGFPDTTKKWMKTGAATFNEGVMTDGLLTACARAMTILEATEKAVRTEGSENTPEQ